MRFPKSLAAALVLGVMFCAGSRGLAHAGGPWIYVSPRPDAVLVSPSATIVLRSGAPIAGDSLSERLFRVSGAASGVHAGQVRLAGDGETIVFDPLLPFAPDEAVRVSVAEGIGAESGQVLGGIDFTFTTWPAEPGAEGQPPEPAASGPWSAPALSSASGLLTLPADFPGLTVTVPASNTAEGYLFLDNLGFGQTYTLILDNSGEPVYYQRMTPSRQILDFKRQPNGLLTYFDALVGLFYGMDSTYT